MEGLFFLVELILIGALGVAACAGLVAFGGAARNGAGLLALGAYMFAFGVGLSLLPQLLWPVASTDNAFLGQFALSFLLLLFGLILAIATGIGLTRRGNAGPIVGRALALAAVGVALSLVLLIVRGPEPWQTRDTAVFGAGTFGFDVILASVVVGVLVFVIGRNARSSPAQRAITPPV